MVIEYIFIGFLSALGWWGANYYVITPYLPEPVFKEQKDKDKQTVEVRAIEPMTSMVEKNQGQTKEVNKVLKEKSNDKID